MTSTPVSLLNRLQEDRSRTDWARFVELYTPLILYWARRLGLQDADANDLAQDVLTRVWQQLRSYQRQAGKRFRGWLWTITRNRWQDYVRRRALPTEPTEQHWNATPDPTDQLAELVEQEYNSYLVSRALQLMRTEFEPKTWQACWEFVVVGRAAQEVADELKITANAVYLAKARVLRRLREELEGLLE